MFKIFPFLKPYRLPITIAISLMLTELAVELIQPLLMAKIIDDGVLQRDMNVVLTWSGVMIGLSLVAFIAGITSSFFAAHVSQSLGYDVRLRLYKKIQSFAFANFNTFPTSSLITRMTNDVMFVQNTIFMGMRIMMRAPLLIIGGVIMALIVNVKLAVSLLIAVPLLMMFLFWVMRKGGKLFRAVQGKLDRVNGVMRENLLAIRLIKALLTKNHEEHRFSEVNEDLRKETTTALRMMEIAIPVMLFVMNISIVFILWFGSVGAINGQTQVGEIVAIVNYTTRITAALSVFSFIIMAYSRAKASTARITEVLETEVNMNEEQNHSSSYQIHGKIEFKDVSFQYEKSGESILKNITFSTKANETVAILGATGSGKSTLFQLIPRLYNVTSGSVLIDEQPIEKMKLDQLRNQIGIVPQEALLFSGSIKENILWGKEGATMEEIIVAAKDAQIHETINALPDKYETKIGQKGVNLSGGQKQRISIARALVRKPKILLLDDSTSALDLKTEEKLLEAIKSYDCTTLIITQKVSTAKEADNILILEEGKLLEQGSHSDLLKTSALYRKIFVSQFGEEELHLAQSTN